MTIPKIEMNRMANPNFQMNVVGGADHHDSAVLTVWVTDRQTGREGVIRFTLEQYENFVFQANSLLSLHSEQIREMGRG